MPDPMTTPHRMTAVFEYDLKQHPGNPFHTDTPFGRPLVLQPGDFSEGDCEAVAEDRGTAMTANPFAALLVGVPRFYNTSDTLMTEDPMGAYVHWHDLMDALAPAVPADLAEAGKVVDEIRRVDPFENPLSASKAEQQAADTIRSLLARIAALRAEIDTMIDADTVQKMLDDAQPIMAEACRGYEEANRDLQSRLTAAEAEVEKLRAERDELERKVPRFPDHMAKIVEAKNAGLPERLQALVAALEAIPDHMRQYQWVADQKQAFGSKWVRAICGDNGKGMGRQAIAEVEGHIDVADFIAAANPDTVALMLAQIAALTARVERLTGALKVIDALDPEQHIRGFSENALRGLVLRMGSTARAALSATEEGHE